jgi:hypothetical protein
MAKLKLLQKKIIPYVIEPKGVRIAALRRLRILKKDKGLELRVHFPKFTYREHLIDIVDKFYEFEKTYFGIKYKKYFKLYKQKHCSEAFHYLYWHECARKMTYGDIFIVDFPYFKKRGFAKIDWYSDKLNSVSNSDSLHDTSKAKKSKKKAAIISIIKRGLTYIKKHKKERINLKKFLIKIFNEFFKTDYSPDVSLPLIFNTTKQRNKLFEIFSKSKIYFSLD